MLRRQLLQGYPGQAWVSLLQDRLTAPAAVLVVKERIVQVKEYEFHSASNASPRKALSRAIVLWSSTVSAPSP